MNDRAEDSAQEPVNVLLVDDREDGLLALEAALSSRKYNLVKARSGMEAIASLYDQTFAVILLDVQMPGMNGFETAKIMRQTENSRTPPIALITPISEDPQHIIEGYDAGAVDYIFKPFDPHILLSKVAIFAELFRRNETIREQAQELVDAERKRSLELSVINKRLEIEMDERQRAQEEILEISECEQKRIGQDLHDGIAQQLTAISFTSHLLAQRLRTKCADEADKAVQILEMTKKAIDETKHLARGFYPIELQRLGLLPALEELVHNTHKLYQADCSHTLDPEVKIDDEAVATHLYRITQEAIHNSVKHGKAKNLQITLGRFNGEIVLTVKDDDVGLKSPRSGGQGMGLRIMRYRAKMMGGALDIHSNSGDGTSVICKIPADKV